MNGHVTQAVAINAATRAPPTERTPPAFYLCLNVNEFESALLCLNCNLFESFLLLTHILLSSV